MTAPAAAAALDPKTPVLVGIGLGGSGAEPAELMAQATESALTDAGLDRLAARVVSIAVPQGSWSYPDPARLVAERVGASTARTELAQLGVPQQRLIDNALSEILRGADGLFVVTGGEARRWQADRARAGADDPGETAQPDADPDVVHARTGSMLEPVELRLRLFTPVLQYAMIENALVAAEGKTVTEGRAEVAALWARFNEVARTNPHAAFPEVRDASIIDTPSPANRPLAFPYNKWHVSQWTVDQAAALVFCSVEAARRHRVPSERWVFPLVGLDSSHAVSLLARRRPERWPAMGVLGRAAVVRIGRPLAECEVTEVYSCFPSAVRVQQRELGLDPTRTPTITGGMAFAGGPLNNFVLQATVAAADRLRCQPESLGLVTTVSGLLTKPGLAVWSGRPDGQEPLLADLADRSSAATEVVEVVDGAPGTPSVEPAAGPAAGPADWSPATVVTATVAFEGMEPRRTVALCDRSDGRRALAVTDDPPVAEQAVDVGLAGRPVEIRGEVVRLA